MIPREGILNDFARGENKTARTRQRGVMRLHTILVGAGDNGGCYSRKRRRARGEETDLNARCLYKFRDAWKQGVGNLHFAY